MAKTRNRQQHYSGIGGQAVLEGVMMRNRDLVAIAVRKPNQEIEVEVDEHHGILEGTIWTKIPFIRGIFVFIDSLVLGIRSTSYSSQFYDDEEGTDLVSEERRARRDKVTTAVTTVISFALAVGIFVLLPYWLTSLVDSYIRSEAFLSVMEGVIRIAIFLIYVLLLSGMKDIRRLYQYHGAEHKCINCIERGKPLTLHYVQDSSRFHKRCGTSFIFLVMIVSIILFFFIRVDSHVMRVVLRLVFIPVVAGISYELIRLAGRYDNIFVRLISAPGVWLQHITTKEPDAQMIEVGIASVEAVFDWKSYLVDEFGWDENELNEF
jgi:uncharacterized protein YqhQ